MLKAIQERRFKMKSGISTACLYPLETENSLKILINLGFKFFEVFFNTYSEIQPDFVKELRKQLDENGCEVKSIHPFTSGFETMLLFSDYERRYLDSLEFYKKYFEAANLLGAEILVLHGERDYFRRRITEETYLVRYARLRELGRAAGVDVAQENVNAFRGEDPGFLRRMREFLHGDCSFVYDIKQAVRAGFDPYEVCSAMGDKIVHIHFNDNRPPEEDCLLPGRGMMDFDKLRVQLQGQGYSGDVVMEVYRRNFGGLEELLTAKEVTDLFAAGFLSKKLETR